MKKDKSNPWYDPVFEAYRVLVEAMESKDDTDMACAVEDAIGFLGQALDE